MYSPKLQVIFGSSFLLHQWKDLEEKEFRHSGWNEPELGLEGSNSKEQNSIKLTQAILWSNQLAFFRFETKLTEKHQHKTGSDSKLGLN